MMILDGLLILGALVALIGALVLGLLRGAGRALRRSEQEDR